jgi:hypothetical protein
VAFAADKPADQLVQEVERPLGLSDRPEGPGRAVHEVLRDRGRIVKRQEPVHSNLHVVRAGRVRFAERQPERLRQELGQRRVFVELEGAARSGESERQAADGHGERRLQAELRRRCRSGVCDPLGLGAKEVVGQSDIAAAEARSGASSTRSPCANSPARMKPSAARRSNATRRRSSRVSMAARSRRWAATPTPLRSEVVHRGLLDKCGERVVQRVDPCHARIVGRRPRET